MSTVFIFPGSCESWIAGKANNDKEMPIRDATIIIKDANTIITLKQWIIYSDAFSDTDFRSISSFTFSINMMFGTLDAWSLFKYSLSM